MIVSETDFTVDGVYPCLGGVSVDVVVRGWFVGPGTAFYLKARIAVCLRGRAAHPGERAGGAFSCSWERDIADGWSWELRGGITRSGEDGIEGCCVVG